jgi:hypothetical protein
MIIKKTATIIISHIKSTLSRDSRIHTVNSPLLLIFESPGYLPFPSRKLRVHSSISFYSGLLIQANFAERRLVVDDWSAGRSLRFSPPKRSKSGTPLGKLRRVPRLSNSVPIRSRPSQCPQLGRTCASGKSLLFSKTSEMLGSSVSTTERVLRR